MAKAKFLVSAKEMQSGTKELLERLTTTQSAVGELLVSVRHSESEMLEKEIQERKAREERERMERLREVLESDQDLAVHIGGTDDDELEATEVPVKQEAAEEPKPANEEPKKEAVTEKEAVKEAEETKSNPAEKPKAEPAKKQTSSGYEARPISPREERRAPQQPSRAPRQDGYTPRPQQRSGGQTGNTTARPQGGTNAPRPPRAAGTTTATATGPTASASGTKERVSNYDPKKGTYTRTFTNNNNNNNANANNRRKNKKAIARDAGPTARNWDEDGRIRRKPKRGGKQQPMHRPEPVVIEKAVITTETITVKDLSEKIGKPAAAIIKKLFMLGIVTTINQEIDFDTCELIASDFGIELEQKIAKTYEEVLTDSADDVKDDPKLLQSRPPVVTIMGHVDHGKTSLLDAIRNSSVTEGEAGGITQHIGAYTVACKGQQITFIDTPGHEAFTSMRARGAQVTDIVILVVAADDGIMPQTVEAINHAKAAGVPIVVAVNKMDKPDANPDRVKQQLTEYELVSEEWGGDTIVVPVSAKTQMGLDTLLEMVLLQADVLELKANSKRLARGTIIEAKLDKGRGPVATVLVQNGTLHRGDTIVAGTAYGKVRAMVDDRGRAVEEAGPSVPVEVLGFSEVPAAGDILNVAEADKLSRQVAEERRDKIKAAQLKSKSRVSLDELFTQMAEDELKELNIIVKADVQGSVEAVKQALEKLSNEEVRVRCIHGGVGAITGTDIMFASASNAIVIGFNVRPDSSARTMAEKENVDVRTYRVIYNAIDDVKSAMQGMFKPIFQETELGRATIRNVFKVSGVGTIAGTYVNEGKITRSAQVRIVRDSVVIHEGKIASLKRFKDDTKEVLTGFECGIGIENYNDLNVDDVIEAFVIEEVKRT